MDSKILPKLKDALISCYPLLEIEEIVEKFTVCCIRQFNGEYYISSCGEKHELFYEEQNINQCCCSKKNLKNIFAIKSQDGDILFPIGSTCIQKFENERLIEQAGRLEEKKLKQETNYYRHECSICNNEWRKKNMTTFGWKQICTFCFDKLPICTFCNEEEKVLEVGEFCHRHTKCKICNNVFNTSEAKQGRCTDCYSKMPKCAKDTCTEKELDGRKLCRYHKKCSKCSNIIDCNLFGEHPNNNNECCKACINKYCPFPCGKRKQDVYKYCWKCPVFQHKCMNSNCEKFIELKYKHCWEHKRTYF